MDPEPEPDSPGNQVSPFGRYHYGLLDPAEQEQLTAKHEKQKILKARTCASACACEISLRVLPVGFSGSISESRVVMLELPNAICDVCVTVVPMASSGKP